MADEQSGPLEASVVCGATVSRCICDAPPGHDGQPHACKCGGKWTGSDEGGDFQVVAYPVGVPGTEGDVRDGLYQLLFGAGF